MRVSWRDGMAGVFVALAGALYLAAARGWDWPAVGTNKGAAVAIGALGILACTVDRKGLESTFAKWDPMGIVLVAVGVAALGLTVAGVVTGSLGVLAVLTATIALQWLLTVARHAVPANKTARITSVVRADAARGRSVS